MQSLSNTTAFFIGVLIVAPVVFWLFLKLKKSAAEKRRVASLLERERAIVATAPEGLFVWDRETGREFCSRRLAVLLNLEAGTKATFEDIRHRFAHAQATLDLAVEALRRDGTPFEVSLPWRDGALGIKGMRGGGGDGRPLSDLLWFHEESEQKEAEEPTLHAVLDALPWPVWLRNDSFDTVFSNRASREAGLNAPDDLARRAGKKGTAQSETHLLGSKESRLMEITETPLPDGQGGLGFAQDRSDREALEGEFSRHAQARDRVLENLATAIAIFDARGKIVFSNAAYETLWGFDASWLATAPDLNEILDRLRKKRKLPEAADFRVYKSEQMALVESLTEPREDVMHLPDGRTLRRFLSPHDMGGLVMAFEDVTGRLALERSHNALIAVQKETLDHLYEGVAVFGGDGRLKLFNPTFAKLWGLDEGFLGGAPHLSDFIETVRPLLYRQGDGEGWPAHKGEIVSRLLGRKPGTGRLARLDGVILDCANVPLPDGAVLLSYLDVTDSAHVEEALRDRAEAMAEANRLKSEFIANVSFEVRTPLNTVIGFADILAGEHFGPLNRRQQEYSRGILETSEGLMSIIEDILDLATIEAGQMSLHADAVDLHAMLASMMSLIRERGRRKSLHLEFDCPPDIGWLVADEKRLKQVLFNLLSNAVSFTPERGTVGLRAERDAEEVRVTVSDTGPGIPPAEREKIFDAFARGSIPREGQGAGLGLSLVKRFVELHGGRVELSSPPGRGTAITCHLPIEGKETP